jgi:O-antigen biosynthesis protein
MSRSSDSRLGRTAQRLLGALTKVRDAGGVMSAAGAAWRMIHREGWRGAARRIGSMSREAARYPQWVAEYDTPDQAALELLRQQLQRAGVDTLISVVVPVYNAPERYLREMIDSVLRQAYSNWELCVADDASTAPHVRTVLDEYARRDTRIRVAYRTANGHISEASNSALELAHGRFIALLDHDDVLPPHALAVVAKYIHAHPDARLFYSDEDKLSEDGRRHTPHFKPDWDPELILQYNVFSHLGVYETALVRKVGGFRRGLEGSQDHDLLLRCVRAAGDRAVVHIPHVLYHWRTIEGSTAVSADEKPYALVASIRAVTDHLREAHLDAEVVAPQADFPFVGIRYRLPAKLPSVHALVVHTGDARALRRCVQSLLDCTAYENLQISVVDAPRDLAISFASVGMIDSTSRAGAMGVRLNDIVHRLDTPYVCFIDERVEFTDRLWLDELMRCAARSSVSAAGPSLWQADGSLYGGAIVLTSDDGGVPLHAGVGRRSAGYFGRAIVTQTVSALPWHCAVARRADFLAAGGFDPQANDGFARHIALSLRIARHETRSLFVPRARVTIHRLRSQGASFDEVPASPVLTRDRAYNPNLALTQADRSAGFDLSFPPRIERFE